MIIIIYSLNTELQIKAIKWWNRKQLYRTNELMETLTCRHSDGHTTASFAPLKCKQWADSYANHLWSGDW